MKRIENEGEILFEEIQPAASKQIRNSGKVIMGIASVAMVINLIIEKGKLTDFSLAIVTILPILLIGNLILDSALITKITTYGIYVRFPPWQPSFSKYYWDDILMVTIRKYNPFIEFWGWGLRFRPGARGYIVKGTTGIEIILKNGKKVLITTQKENEVNELLRRIEK